jgi:methionyl-tRNA formyltransferase
MPEYGTFNLHASLLPQYRGAAPINWAIMNGERETGVTTFFIKHEIDTGNIILQEKEPIHDHDNVGTLYERLMVKGANLVVKTVEAIRDDSYTLKEQKEFECTHHAPKLFKETCEINWTLSSKEIYDFIRGLSPYPAAWTKFHDKTYKIFDSKLNPMHLDGIPGMVMSTQDEIFVKTGDGTLKILDLQVEGKKRMKSADFLRGNKI